MASTSLTPKVKALVWPISICSHFSCEHWLHLTTGTSQESTFPFTSLAAPVRLLSGFFFIVLMLERSRDQCVNLISFFSMLSLLLVSSSLSVLKSIYVLWFHIPTPVLFPEHTWILRFMYVSKCLFTFSIGRVNKHFKLNKPHTEFFIFSPQNLFLL